MRLRTSLLPRDPRRSSGAWRALAGFLCGLVLGLTAGFGVATAWWAALFALMEILPFRALLWATAYAPVLGLAYRLGLHRKPRLWRPWEVAFLASATASYCYWMLELLGFIHIGPLAPIR